MNIMRIESLLSEITNLYKLAEKDKLERIKQGDFFNVFNTIGLRTEEVRLHSAFIAELLNPQGLHGLSNLFLQAFLKQMEHSQFIDNGHLVILVILVICQNGVWGWSFAHYI